MLHVSTGGRRMLAPLALTLALNWTSGLPPAHPGPIEIRAFQKSKRKWECDPPCSIW